MDYLEQILDDAGFNREIENIIITCVDPSYPADTVGGSTEVHYTDSLHDLCGHVQQIGDPELQFQVSLVYEAETGRFSAIPQEKVHDNLGNGVVQLTYDHFRQTLVIGIPGDVVAFSEDSEYEVPGLEGCRSVIGFAFGNPNKAPAGLARLLLLSIINDYSTIPNSEISVTAMAHPDCGHYAATEAVTFSRAFGPVVDELLQRVGVSRNSTDVTEEDLAGVTGRAYVGSA